MSALQIKYRSLESLIPYVRNARTHSDGQIAQIAGSIEEFGMAGTIVVRQGVIARGTVRWQRFNACWQPGSRSIPPRATPFGVPSMSISCQTHGEKTHAVSGSDT